MFLWVCALRSPLGKAERKVSFHEQRDARLVFSPCLEWVPYGRALWQEPQREGHVRRRDRARERLTQAVNEAIQTELTEKQREVVELYFFEGLPQDEIALRLGVSQQVVSKRLYGTRRKGKLVGGAMARLRRVLSPHLEGWSR